MKSTEGALLSPAGQCFSTAPSTTRSTRTRHQPGPRHWSLTSATTAARDCSTPSAATEIARAMLSGAKRDPPAAQSLVGNHRPRGGRPEWRDRAALVPGGLLGHLRVRHGQAADAEQCPQLWPGDRPVARHQDEQEVTLAAPHYQGLHDIAGLDPPRRGRLGQAAHWTVRYRPVRDPRRVQRLGRRGCPRPGPVIVGPVAFVACHALMMPVTIGPASRRMTAPHASQP